MQRALYRAYLYGIIVILLYFTAIATTVFLSVLLQPTPLNGSAPSPVTGSQIVQPAVFAIISWIITVSVGGLHYWLLRRNEATDPTSADSSVRAFFLNGGEAVAALVALTGGTIALNIVFQSSGAAAAFATLLVFAALFLLFELERRRRTATAGVALAFQQLHLSGLQLIFLTAFLLPALVNALSASLYAFLLATGGITACGPIYSFPQNAYCYNYSQAYTSLGTLWLIVGLVALACVGYWRLAQGNALGNLVTTIHFLGFATGVIVTLVALERGLELLARILLGVGATGADLVGPYDFISPLLAGLVVVGAFSILLREDSTSVSRRSGGIMLTALAVTAALAALPFWLGSAILLEDVIERFVPQGSIMPLTVPLALIGTGIGYIPLEAWLRARSRRTGAARAPRRAFELVLLAVGVLGTVISLVVLLYAILTAALGNPLYQWQQLARTAASVLVVLLVLSAVYGRQVLVNREHDTQNAEPLPERAPTAAASAAGGVSSADSIEGILDQLLAGAITREQAAERIRALKST
jgi:hypothetical protein